MEYNSRRSREAEILVIELFDELRTCDDVRAFRTRGIGEGPMMDYKESISFREQGTLTEGAKKAGLYI